MTRDVHRISLYLDGPLLAQARGGDLPVSRTLEAAASATGQGFRLYPNTEKERLRSTARPGLAVFYRSDPFHSRALCLRHAYCGPFWRLERGSDRSRFSVARARFDPDRVDPVRARRFAAWLRGACFRSAPEYDPNGHIYIPLQAKLLERRAFQAVSPLEMVATTARRFPNRTVVVAPHPGADLSSAEQSALSGLLCQHANLTLRTEPAEVLLDGASLLVTQTSTVGFLAHLVHVPVVLFGDIDFHHISASVARDGLDDAFLKPPETELTVDRYVHWFLTRHSFRDDRDPDAVLRLLDRRGWRARACVPEAVAGC